MAQAQYAPVEPMPYPLLPRALHGGPQAANETVLDFSVNTNPNG